MCHLVGTRKPLLTPHCLLISGFLRSLFRLGLEILETVLWKSPGLTFRAGARNALKLSSGSLLGSLSGLGPEMLQNYPLEASWAHFPSWVQKCLQTMLWRPSWLTFRVLFNKPDVRQTHVQQTLCSTNSMFNKPYVQHTRVQQNLC